MPRIVLVAPNPFKTTLIISHNPFQNPQYQSESRLQCSFPEKKKKKIKRARRKGRSGSIYPGYFPYPIMRLTHKDKREIPRKGWSFLRKKN